MSDVYPTATVRAADLVLPSAMWVEKNGMFGNSERRTQQWFKMVNPPGEARDDGWQIIAVARKLHDMGFASTRRERMKPRGTAERSEQDQLSALWGPLVVSAGQSRGRGRRGALRGSASEADGGAEELATSLDGVAP
ncbi:molybdopterin-dependent oxidoreductase [Sorangium sp. So ce1151]